MISLAGSKTKEVKVKRDYQEEQSKRDDTKFLKIQGNLLEHDVLGKRRLGYGLFQYCNKCKDNRVFYVFSKGFSCSCCTDVVILQGNSIVEKLPSLSSIKMLNKPEFIML